MFRRLRPFAEGSLRGLFEGFGPREVVLAAALGLLGVTVSWLASMALEARFEAHAWGHFESLAARDGQMVQNRLYRALSEIERMRDVFCMSGNRHGPGRDRRLTEMAGELHRAEPAFGGLAWAGLERAPEQGPEPGPEQGPEPGVEQGGEGSGDRLLVEWSTALEGGAVLSPGFDLMGEASLRGTVAQARDQGRVRLSGAWDERWRAAVLVVAPIYRRGTNLMTREGRHGGLEGVLAAVLWVDRLVDGAVVPRQGMVMRVEDLDGGLPGRLLHRVGRVGRGGQVVEPREELRHAMRLETEGRRWILVWRGGRDFYTADPHWGEHQPVLGAGLLLTALSLLYLLTVQRQALLRRRAERARGESERRLRRLIQRMPVMMEAFDTEGTIVAWNEECERVTGYAAEEIIGDPDSMARLYPDPAYREPLMEAWTRIGNAYREWQWELTTKGGARRTIAWSNLSDDAPMPGWNSWEIGVDVTERVELEQRLRREKERAEQYLNIAGVIIVALDTDGRVVLINRRGCEVLGYEESELIGRDWMATVIPGDQRGEVLGTHHRVVGGNHSADLFINEVVTRDGERRLVAWRNRSVLDERGEVVGSLSSGEDITEQRRAEEALRRSEQRYRSLFDSAGDGIFILEGERFVACNDSALKLTGWRREQIVGHTPVAISPPLQPNGRRSDEAAREIIERVCGGEPTHFEWTHLRADGSTVDVEISLTRVGEEAPPLLFAVWRDVTARKRAEAALFAEVNERQRAERFLQRVINALADPLFVKDEGHRWVLINDAFCDFVGYPREALIGKSDFDFFPEEQARIFWEKDDEVFRRGGEVVNEELMTDADGVVHTLLTKKYLFAEEGGGRTLVGLVRDITEQKAADALIRRHGEELERVNRELEEFTYGAGHDLKEPLRTLRGYCDFLPRDIGEERPDRVAEDLGFITDALGRMDRVVEGLLQLSRAGRLELREEAVELERCMAEVLGNLDGRIGELGATLSWEALPVVTGDPGYLTRALQNLVENALKFRGEAPPVVTVSAERTVDGGAWELCLRDNGIGIDAPHLERIFEPFQRLHGISRYPGSGLGLAVVRKVIERHGGRVWAESEIGRGTLFHIRLPVRPEGDGVADREASENDQRGAS